MVRSRFEKVASINASGSVAFAPSVFYTNGATRSSSGLFEFAMTGTKPVAFAKTCIAGFGVPEVVAADGTANAYALNCKLSGVVEYTKKGLQTLRTFDMGAKGVAIIVHKGDAFTKMIIKVAWRTKADALHGSFAMCFCYLCG